jgi:hypothetical protein
MKQTLTNARIGRITWRLWPQGVAGVTVVAILALLAWSYRELPGRLFAADDYQWLLNTRGLGPGTLLRRAFDPASQHHFFRPLVWLAIAAQQWLFGPDAARFHLVSLALHGANALLVGLLAWRIIGVRSPTTTLFAVLAGGLVTLHPAPFEAVVWISAQSELLGALLLLLALHAWLWRGTRATMLASAALVLAMLAKESAVLGLPLMLLVGPASRTTWRRALLPALITLGYLVLQVYVAQSNTVLREGLYGIGTHLLANPLRSLALIAAPLGGTEHADAAWLVAAGACAGLALLALAAWSLAHEAPMLPGGQPAMWRLVAALLLTLAPTAPFVSPPDSRYLYLPVVFGALVMAVSLARLQAARPAIQPGLIGAGLLAVALLGWAPAELAAREWRFGAGNGSGGSLWRVASDVCSIPVADRPGRLVIGEPPITPAHVEAIVHLACGDAVEVVLVGRADRDGALRERSVAIGFQGGSAVIEQWR